MTYYPESFRELSLPWKLLIHKEEAGGWKNYSKPPIVHKVTKNKLSAKAEYKGRWIRKDRRIIETPFKQGCMLSLKSTWHNSTRHDIFWLEMDLDKIGQLSAQLRFSLDFGGFGCLDLAPLAGSLWTLEQFDAASGRPSKVRFKTPFFFPFLSLF